jgi:hypothetical protein
MGQDQEQWLQLVQDASANVKAARLLDADWPEGTLEQADEALDAAPATRTCKVASRVCRLVRVRPRPCARLLPCTSR